MSGRATRVAGAGRVADGGRGHGAGLATASRRLTGRRAADGRRGRAGAGRAGPDRAGAGRAGPDRAGADRAGAGAAGFVAAVGEVAAALRVGAAPAAAWSRVGVRCDGGAPCLPDVVGLGAAPRHAAAVVAATCLSAELGAPPAALLERVALAVARDVEAEGRRRSELAGPRATARLLAWLPVGGLGLGLGLGADPVAHLLDGRAGTMSGVLGAGLMVAGHRWSRAVLRAAERAGDE